jgi:Recombinase zinc beta ribbon domain
LTASAAMRTLINPRYAGAYAYGRRRYRRSADGKHAIQSKRNSGDWLACIPDAHPGYITWTQYQHNLNVLQSNGRGYEIARNSPPREGAALLQGRAVCGRCGRHFRARYAARRGRLDVWYVCDRAHAKDGEPSCQTINGAPVDAAIGALVAEKMTPAAVELALEIRREIEARHEEADRLRSRTVERAQQAADLAQRRFMMVDPGNRLVADTLEREWNEKLRILAQSQEAREQSRQQDRLVIDGTVRRRLEAMTADFKTIWTDPDTANRERKRLLAYVIEDATLIKHSKDITTIHVRFRGGKTESLTVQNPKSFAQRLKTSPQVVALIDKLLDEHTYPEIADQLNAQGLRPSGTIRPGRADSCFTALRVSYLAKAYKLRPRFDRLRDRGLLTPREAAARLKIHELTLVRWANVGIITRHAYEAQAYLYEMPSKPPVKHSSRWDRLADRVQASRNSRK